MTEHINLGPAVNLGLSHNYGKSLINCLFPNVEYKNLTSSCLQLATDDTRICIYQTNFDIDVPLSRSLYNYANNRTMDTKVLVDTKRDYSAIDRYSYDFFLEDTILTLKDMRVLFKD